MRFRTIYTGRTIEYHVLMPWVRAHYRRPRRHRSDIRVLLGLIGLLFLAAVAAAYALVTLVVTGAALVRTYLRWRRQRALDDLAAKVRAIASKTLLSEDDVRSVERSFRALSPLPAQMVADFQALYRDQVAAAISDHDVSAEERHRLTLLGRLLRLDPQTLKQTEIEAFLQVFSAVIADGKLTEAEEQIVERLRRGLDVPDDAIREQLRIFHQLRQKRQDLLAELQAAQEVLQKELMPVEAPIPLRRGEACYLISPYTEKKERVVESYNIGGARFSEKGLIDHASGTLYATNKRVLLVSSGSKSIDHNKILDIKVDADTCIMALTVDGRRTPYYLDVPRPFYAAAILNRLQGAEAARVSLLSERNLTHRRDLRHHPEHARTRACRRG